MEFYLGVTDNAWYSFLSQRDNEDVNFWQPSGRTNFKAVKEGAPFLFKLKKPMNAIGGIGFFSSHSILPLDVAWDIFEERNGLKSYLEFKNKIIAYRDSGNSFASNPNIGCIVLTDPIFFKPADWIQTPEDWSNSIVQGKTYSSADLVGKRVWLQVQQNLEKYQFYARAQDKSTLVKAEDEDILPQYGKNYLQKVRLGQGAFRVQLTEAYQRRCAISGEKTLPVLEAAHIKPYAESGPHHLTNGLLLRADLHKLFDTGYLTITRNHKIEVSKKIKEEFENGKDYYKYHGNNLLILPNQVHNYPEAKYIDWHNENLYNG